jgi:diguanylate cyclase (GGDEF)-like protein
VARKVGARTSVTFRIAVVTAASTFVSVAATYWAMSVAFGNDPNATIAVADAKYFGLIAATALPLAIAPPTAYWLIRLVRALNQAQNELQKLAQTDQLTSLLNRRGFDTAARGALEAARTAGQPVALLMCDVDHFKNLNDSFGHSFGDNALVHVANAFAAIARGTNFIVGRHGGDEFAMMLPGVSGDGAAATAERLRLACAEKIADGEIAVDGVSLSVGVAVCERAAASLTALMGRADAALYEGKQAGRNRVVVAAAPKPFPEPLPNAA